jgi:hypothetical protein
MIRDAARELPPVHRVRLSGASQLFRKFHRVHSNPQDTGAHTTNADLHHANARKSALDGGLGFVMLLLLL